MQRSVIIALTATWHLEAGSAFGTLTAAPPQASNWYPVANDGNVHGDSDEVTKDGSSESFMASSNLKLEQLRAEFLAQLSPAEQAAEEARAAGVASLTASPCDFAGALASFDEALLLRPAGWSTGLWQRGAALYGLGRYAEAADQLECDALRRAGALDDAPSIELLWAAASRCMLGEAPALAWGATTDGDVEEKGLPESSPLDAGLRSGEKLSGEIRWQAEAETSGAPSMSDDDAGLLVEAANGEPLIWDGWASPTAQAAKQRPIPASVSPLAAAEAALKGLRLDLLSVRLLKAEAAGREAYAEAAVHKAEETRLIEREAEALGDLAAAAARAAVDDKMRADEAAAQANPQPTATSLRRKPRGAAASLEAQTGLAQPGIIGCASNGGSSRSVKQSGEGSRLGSGVNRGELAKVVAGYREANPVLAAARDLFACAGAAPVVEQLGVGAASSDAADESEEGLLAVDAFIERATAQAALHRLRDLVTSSMESAAGMFEKAPLPLQLRPAPDPKGRAFLGHFFAGLWFSASRRDPRAAALHMARAAACAHRPGGQRGVLESLAEGLAERCALEEGCTASGDESTAGAGKLVENGRGVPEISPPWDLI